MHMHVLPYIYLCIDNVIRTYMSKYDLFHALRFANHQRSKKHKENAALLRKLLQEEDASMQAQKSHDNSDQSDHSIDGKLEQIDTQDPASKILKAHDDNDQLNHSIEKIQDQNSSTCTTNKSNFTTDEDLPSSSVRQEHHDDHSPVGSDSEDVLLSLLRCYCPLYSSQFVSFDQSLSKSDRNEKL